MINKQIKAMTYGVISSLLILSSANVSASFDGTQMNVRWEIWDKVNPGKGGSVLGVTDEIDIVASNTTSPDIKDFHKSRGTFELWDIDFTTQGIDLTYTSINVRDVNHQYMYMSAMGFHFEDTENNLPDIVSVTVASEFTPFGFNPNLLTFDANNIYVDLTGSMCHVDGMASMPSCTNISSPTGYDNQIKLTIVFADNGEVKVPSTNTDNARIDSLYAWAEQKYPQFFSSSQQSTDIQGYYARHYPENDIYLGSKEGRLYVVGAPFGGLLDLGDLEKWYTDLSL
ncbi:MAG: hypothetical protein Q9M50_13315 [Methylococcales bacterium]|nr:hypothetical protein [Methylococcales bacterium]